MAKSKMCKLRVHYRVTAILTTEGMDHLFKEDPTSFALHFNVDTMELETHLWNLMRIFGKKMFVRDAEPMFLKNTFTVHDD